MCSSSALFLLNPRFSKFQHDSTLRCSNSEKRYLLLVIAQNLSPLFSAPRHKNCRELLIEAQSETTFNHFTKKTRMWLCSYLATRSPELRMRCARVVLCARSLHLQAQWRPSKHLTCRHLKGQPLFPSPSVGARVRENALPSIGWHSCWDELLSRPTVGNAVSNMRSRWLRGDAVPCYECT